MGQIRPVLNHFITAAFPQTTNFLIWVLSMCLRSPLYAKFKYNDNFAIDFFWLLYHWNRLLLTNPAPVLVINWSDCGVPIEINSSILVQWHMWPRDAIWRHRAGSALAQVMACYLMAQRHYLNESWLTINCVQWRSPEKNYTCAHELNPWH